MYSDVGRTPAQELRERFPPGALARGEPQDCNGLAADLGAGAEEMEDRRHHSNKSAKGNKSNKSKFQAD